MLYLVVGSAAASLFLIIIHFFGLRLRQKLEFSHIQFLAALNAQTKSVRKINNLLLLLLRLVFVLSALAAFGLYLYNQQNTGAVSSSSSVTAVFDRTWSMQSKWQTEEVNKAFQAQKDASQLLKVNKSATVTSSGANLADQPISLVASVEESILSQIGQGSSSSAHYVFSDFQKSTFTNEVLTELSAQKNVTLVPYVSGGPNFFIDSVWLDQPVLMPGSSVTLKARVASSLQTDNKQVTVQLTEGNALLGTSQVLMEAGQKRMVQFQLKADRNEARKLVFEVEDPANPFDNKFYALVPKPSKVPVKVQPALPKNHPVLQAYSQEAAFDFTDQPAAAGSFWILSASANALSSGNQQNMKQWLADGGNVLVLPQEGNQRPLLSFLTSLGLTGIREAAPQTGEKVLRQPDFSDSFFKRIFEKEVRNLKMPSAAPVLYWQSSFHTILKFTDNSPFLSSFKVGKGTVHLFSAPVKAADSFSGHPLFVPVLYQLALSSSGTVTLAHQPANGTIALPAPALGAGKEPFKLRGKTQIFIPQQQIAQNQLQLTLPQEVAEPGFYEVLKGTEVVSQLALNIPAPESKLESFTAEELRTYLAEKGSAVKVMEPSSRVPLEKQLQTGERQNSVWKYCLILCLLCLMAEAIILSTKKRGSLI